MPIRNAIPIKNPVVWPNVMSLDPLESPRILSERYLDFFTRWVLNSSNDIQGLNMFDKKTFCHGTIQAFDHFYIKHAGKRVRFFQGEFAYHRVCVQNSYKWKYIDHDLEKNDIVVISAPFSDLGSIHPDMESVLSRCDQLEIPVLIDMAYICISQNTTINLCHPCIETVVTSLSKAFFGAQFLRVGIRWQKDYHNDGIDMANEAEMLPLVNMKLAINHFERYGLDWNWQTYGEIYQDTITELGLQPTNCILFGLGDETYQDYNRGNKTNRVCISQEIGEKYASMQSQ
jgi:hypothetical protein